MVIRWGLTPLGSGGNRRRFYERRCYHSSIIIFALFAMQITMLFADEVSTIHKLVHEIMALQKLFE